MEKNTVILFGLLLVTLFLSGTVAGAKPGSPVPELAVLVPILALALMTWYLIVLIINRDAVITALAAILLGRGGGAPGKTSILITIVTNGVLLGLVILVLISGIPQRLVNGIAGIMAQSGAQTSPPTSISPILGTLPAAIITAYGTTVFVAIFAISLLILIQGFRLAFQNKGAGVRDDQGGSHELTHDVVGVVQQAISSLKAAREYHETILQCYQRMCMILSDAGIVQIHSDTAREFAEDVSLKLRAGSDAVQALTFLFEEARYSNHQITEEKRVMAVQYLESLQQALSAHVGLGA